MYLSLYVYFVSLFVLYDNFIVLCFLSLLLCWGEGCVCTCIYMHVCNCARMPVCMDACMCISLHLPSCVSAFYVNAQHLFNCVAINYVGTCLYVYFTVLLAGSTCLLCRLCVSFNHCLVNLCTCLSEDSCCRIWSWRAVGWSLTRPGFRIGSCPHQQHTMLCSSKTTKQIT